MKSVAWKLICIYQKLDPVKSWEWLWGMIASRPFIPKVCMHLHLKLVRYNKLAWGSIHLAGTLDKVSAYQESSKQVQTCSHWRCRFGVCIYCAVTTSLVPSEYIQPVCRPLIIMQTIQTRIYFTACTHTVWRNWV